MKQSDMLFRSGLWLAIVAACLFISGCGPLTRLNAVPLAEEKHATVLDLPEAGYWGDGDPAAFRQAMVESFYREQTLLRSMGHTSPVPTQPVKTQPVKTQRVAR